MTSWFLRLCLLYAAVVIWCSKTSVTSCLRTWKLLFTISEAVLAVLEKGIIRGICSVFIFGLDVAIFMPQASTVFSVSVNPELFTVEPKCFSFLK